MPKLASPPAFELHRVRIRYNLLAGLASSAWSAALGLAVVPLYLKYLGVEAYGLVGFLVTLQTLLSLLDLGLAPAMNREIARGIAQGNLRPARELLHALSLIYGLTGIMIALAISLAAPFIAAQWFQSQQLSPETLATCTVLMGVVIGCRWPGSIYLGTLIGAEKMVLSSVVAAVMGTLGSVGAAAILAWVSRRIEVFFVWQAAVGLLNTFVLRKAAWHTIGHEPDLHFSGRALKRIWRFSADLSGVTLCAVLLTQIDKVVLSHFISLTDFGCYSLATLIASSLYLLSSPTFNIVYPRFSSLVARGDVDQLTDLYRRGTRLFAIATFPLAMLLAVFASDLLRLWTGDPLLAHKVAPVVALLAIGSALHGVMYFPYALQLAYGKTHLPLTINIMLLTIAAPLTGILAWHFGMIGGAAAWVALHGLYVLIGTSLTHRELLRHAGWAWISRDVGVPLVVCLAVGLLGSQMIAQGTWDPLGRIGVAALLLVVAIAASLLMAPRHTMPRFLYSLRTRAAP